MKNDKVVEFGEILAKDYPTREEYWFTIGQKIVEIFDWYPKTELVMEDFRLYGHKALQQTNSQLETPRLIGYLEMNCFKYDIYINFQMASRVKNRWNEDILVRKGYLTEKPHGKTVRYMLNDTIINDHIRDALKHGLHYYHFGNNKG